VKWAVLLLTASAALAQEPRFQTRAHEVLVPVSVMTKNSHPVENLAASDFLVLNDGKPQAVRMISRDADPLPIYAVIVLQTNDSSDAALAKIRKTASVVSSYITNDMGTGTPSFAAVVSASDEVRIAQDFTADPGILDDVFAKIKAKGDSARLLDGVSLACDMLAARKQHARRVVVLISESRDRQSKAHFADVAMKAQKDDIVVYTLSYSAYATAFTQKASDRPPPPDEPGLYDPNNAGGGGMNLLAIGAELARLAKVNIADALAQATGGGHNKFTTLHGLETQLSAIGTEIHNRYTLTFVPPEPQPAGYHRLSVSIRKSGDFHVHARAGYWTSSE
jgi:Ca-activated chloride channel family protein